MTRRVVVIMGSPSDKKHILASGMMNLLETVFGLDDVHVASASAHRNPTALREIASLTMAEGAQVYIAIAGLTAALPGALAAELEYARPVIGVPLDEDGLPACVRTPPGVPIACSGHGKSDVPGSANAALINAAEFACQIIGIADSKVAVAYAEYKGHSTKQPEPNVDPTTLLKED